MQLSTVQGWPSSQAVSVVQPGSVQALATLTHGPTPVMTDWTHAGMAVGHLGVTQAMTWLASMSVVGLPLLPH